MRDIFQGLSNKRIYRVSARIQFEIALPGHRPDLDYVLLYPNASKPRYRPKVNYDFRIRKTEIQGGHEALPARKDDGIVITSTSVDSFLNTRGHYVIKEAWLHDSSESIEIGRASCRDRGCSWVLA